jgi:choline oxidase
VVPPGPTEADVVVVGAGAAGLPLAVRLAEAGQAVVVLEAGGAGAGRRAVEDIRFYTQAFGTDLDHDFEIVPEPGGNELVRYAAGRVLGGGSSINSAAAMGLPDADLRRWAESLGPTWSPAALTEARDRVDRAIHPRPASPPSPLSEAFLAAAASAGYPAFELGGRLLADGSSLLPLTAAGRRRHSAAAAYLPAGQGPPGLTLRLDCSVRRILFGPTNRAYAVEVGSGQLIRARQEIVIAAGALNTPKLLMLSGIGPADHLHGFGIDVVVDSPRVGQGLVDHPDVAVLWAPAGPVPDSAAHGWETVMAASSEDGLELPDLIVNFATVPYDLHTAPKGYPTHTDALSMSAFLARPLSRGEVRLRGGGCEEAPVVRPGFFTDPGGEDLRRLGAAVTIMRDVAATEPLCGELAGELAPGPAVSGAGALAEYVRSVAGTMLHPAGTCAMGAGAEAVLDPAFRVRGVSGLRVVDAAAFPDPVSVNPCLACMTLGERAFELITAAADEAKEERHERDHETV